MINGLVSVKNDNLIAIMARMLAARDSTEHLLNLARRHQRLARRYKQAALVASIQSAIDGLTARQTAGAEKELDRQAAYDDGPAADGDLDDAIRNRKLRPSIGRIPVPD